VTIPIIIGVILVAGVILAIRAAMKRSAQQRAAHDARLRTMAQAALAAAKKKQAAAAAAAAAAPSPAATAEPVREERECPFCAELILKKARVCKHCGREVEPLQ
jgi:Na+-transporting NADH:ubiquinone oxidoreductase subunit NqrC